MNALAALPVEERDPSVEFDFQAVFYEELESSCDPDPMVAFRAAAKRIPDERLRDVLHLVGRRWARDYSAYARRASSHIADTTIVDAPSSGAPARSRRWDQVRDAGPEFLEKLLWRREAIDGKGGYAFLGDCTRDNLLHAAKVRFDQAKANARTAVQYQTLADKLTEHNVERVADLPAEVLVEVLVR